MDMYFAKTVDLNVMKFDVDAHQTGKKCRAKLRTDIDVSNIITGNMEQNQESDSHQIERVRIKRQAQCISN